MPWPARSPPLRNRALSRNDLHRWAELYQVNADEAMTRVSDWGTKLLYGLAVIFVAWQVIRLFAGYLGFLNSTANSI